MASVRIVVAAIAVAVAVASCSTAADPTADPSSTPERWLAALALVPDDDASRAKFAVADWGAYWDAVAADGAGASPPPPAGAGPAAIRASGGICVTGFAWDCRRLLRPDEARVREAFGFERSDITAVAAVEVDRAAEHYAVVVGDFAASAVLSAATSDPVFGELLDDRQIRGHRVLGAGRDCALDRSTAERLQGCERALAAPAAGTLLFGMTVESVERMLSTFDGEHEDLASDPDVRLLVDRFAELGATGFVGGLEPMSVGEAFAGAPFVDQLASQPRLEDHVAYGIGGGGPRPYAVVVYADEEAAAAAVPRFERVLTEVTDPQGRRLAATLQPGPVRREGRALVVAFDTTAFGLVSLIQTEPALLFGTA